MKFKQIPYERLYKCDCCNDLAFKCDKCRKMVNIVNGGSLVEDLDVLMCSKCINTQIK